MSAHRPCVRLVVCGMADRGDDGAAIAAVARLLPALPDRLRSHLEVRRCGQLDPVDLLGERGEPDAVPVVVDTIVGVEPGQVVTMPLVELARARATGGLALRSMLPLAPDVVARVANDIVCRPVAGTLIGVGGRWFGYGHRFSRAVKAALPALEAAILFELERLVGGGDGGTIDEPMAGDRVVELT